MEHPLRAYRVTHGLSLGAMARTVGTSKQTVWRIERGRHNPTVRLIQKIIEATGGAVTADMIVAAAPVPAEDSEAA